MKKLGRVFSVVPDCHVSRGYYRLLWDRHFYQGIAGEVEELIIPSNVSFDWARGWEEPGAGEQRQERARVSQVMLSQLRAAHSQRPIDCVLSYCFARDVEPELVREVIRMGIPWVNFFCDSTHMFSQVEPLARVVSLNWFPESQAESRYKALGVPYLLRPYAMNARHLMPVDWDVGCKAGAGFVGFPSANRITVLGWFELFGARVDIRGRGWTGPAENPFYSPIPAGRRALGALFQRGLGEKILRRLFWPLVRRRALGELKDDQFFEYLAGRLMILGLNQGRDEEGRLGSYIKFRDLEFPGYGCCYLTEHNADISAALEPGVEVLTFRSPYEGASMIKSITRDPDRARRIGEAGRRRVLAEHTWGKRLDEISRCL